MTQEKQREKLYILAFKYSAPTAKRGRRILIFLALFYRCRAPPPSSEIEEPVFTSVECRLNASFSVLLR